MKKIYLHIGLPKTGTTTIQETLKQYSDVLLKLNYLYPDSLPSNHSVPAIQFFHENASKYTADLNFLRNWDKNEFAKELLEKKDIENLIISGEAIITFNKKEIQKLKDFFYDLGFAPEYKIIIFIRNPIDFITSLTQSRVKLLRSISKVKKGLLKKQILLFQKMFGKCEFEVIKFEDAYSSKFGLVGYFLNQINIPPQILTLDNIHRQNISISYQSYEILDYIRFFVPYCKDNNIDIGFDRKEIFPLTQISGVKFHLSKFEIEKINKLTLKENKWVKKHFNISYQNVFESQKNQHIIYDELYKNELVEKISLIPDPLKFLVYDFIRNKENLSTNCNDKLLFESLRLMFENEYFTLFNKYRLIDEFKIKKKYNKLKNSSFPNDIF